MSKAVENSLKKQEVISRAAREIFLRDGFAGASMDDIARRAGVTKQTVYRYFPSKLDMFRAALESCAESVPAAHVFGSRDIGIELYDYAVRFLRFHLLPEQLDIYRLLVSEGRKAPGVGDVFYANGPGRSCAMLESFVEKHVPGIHDVERKVFCFIAMLLHLRAPLLFGIRDAYPDDEIRGYARNVVDIFLCGILPPEQRNSGHMTWFENSGGRP